MAATVSFNTSGSSNYLRDTWTTGTGYARKESSPYTYQTYTYTWPKTGDTVKSAEDLRKELKKAEKAERKAKRAEKKRKAQRERAVENLERLAAEGYNDSSYKAAVWLYENA